MKDREQMPEYTQNLLKSLDEKFPSSAKPFGLLATPDEKAFGTLEPIDDPEDAELIIDTPAEATTLTSDGGALSTPEPAKEEPGAPPTWFHTLNSSLQEKREADERRQEAIERELRELRQQSLRMQVPPAQTQAAQSTPAIDPNALASMGDVSNAFQATQKELQGLKHEHWQMAMRNEYERSKAGYMRAVSKHPELTKMFDQKTFDDVWSRWTNNNPARSANTDWEAEFTTAYKARNYDGLSSKVEQLQKSLDELKTKQAPAAPSKEQAAAKKNLTLIPRPGTSRAVVDSPAAADNPLFKKSGNFREYGRSLLKGLTG